MTVEDRIDSAPRNSGQRRVSRSRRIYQRFAVWARRTRLSTKLAILLTIAGLVAGMATYAALTGTPPLGPDPDQIFILLNIDLIILLALAAIVARRIVSLAVERRRGQAGSKLHLRLAVRFSLVAVVPSIVVATFSAVMFNFGVQSWFDNLVRTAIEESRIVAEAYFREHGRALELDIREIATILNDQSNQLQSNQLIFARFVDDIADAYELSELVIAEGDGDLVIRSSETAVPNPIPFYPGSLQTAQQGNVAVFPSADDDKVRAMIRLANFEDSFLIVSRPVQPIVIGYLERVQAASSEYNTLRLRSSELQITFTAIYIGVALLLLMISVRVGLLFADRLVTPISALISASERVRAGDLTVRVPTANDGDELTSLGRSFNRMTGQLESQRRELVEANRQLDDRRRFTEAVLTGVTSGVLGLTPDGTVTLANKAATELLGVRRENLVGRKLVDEFSDFSELLENSKARYQRVQEKQIKIWRGGEMRTLLVRVTLEPGEEALHGHVVTFDDITELLSAQRKAAWADVARRIAHEIKNPLTPIQLSAERLKRRYLKQITSDPETFELCTDTIVRQVGDLGRMVDEFSAFARMPNPVMREENVADLIRQSVELQKQAYPKLTFDLDLPDRPVTIVCDTRQIGQLLTNLIQNAHDAIEGRRKREKSLKGRIGLRLVAPAETEQVRIVIVDNGKGLPDGDRDRLTEPYVTTREKGTGLGLAIVKKIVEDHAGTLTLEDREAEGARVTVTLPVNAGAKGGDHRAQD
ncbi:MAG: PAS domain-containing sensor histidine kinase [Azospirillaceae bacterium]